MTQQGLQALGLQIKDVEILRQALAEEEERSRKNEEVADALSRKSFQHEEDLKESLRTIATLQGQVTSIQSDQLIGKGILFPP